MTERTPQLEPAAGAMVEDAAEVIAMPGGMPGFETCERFVLVTLPDLQPLTCLQGLDGARPSFLAVDPRIVEPGFSTHLSDSDRLRLGADASEVLLWLALVTVNAAGGATVNLRAPLVINPRRMMALQLVTADSPYAVDHPIQAE